MHVLCPLSCCMLSYKTSCIMYRVPRSVDESGLEVFTPAETRVIVIYHRLVKAKADSLLYLSPSIPYKYTQYDNVLVQVSLSSYQQERADRKQQRYSGSQEFSPGHFFNQGFRSIDRTGYYRQSPPSPVYLVKFEC
jgi:hypothetical protein